MPASPHATSRATSQATVILRVEPDVCDLLDRSLRRRLERRCRRMLSALQLAHTELSVLLAADPTVARLNEAWRHKAGPTDVLSFPQATASRIQHWRNAPPSDDEPDRVLGDLIISLQVVTRRSPTPSAFEHDLNDLLAHGLLHLVGHDHPTPKARRDMLALQARLVTLATGRGKVQRL